MKNHHIRFVVVAGVVGAFTFAANASAQDWAPPPPQPAPVPVQQLPLAEQIEIETETETTIQSATNTGGAAETPRAAGDTNVRVAVGVRTESPPPPQTTSVPGSRPQGGDERPEGEEPELARFLHGFRLGYLYIHDIEGPVDTENPSSPVYSDRYGIRSPHMFMLGYEAAVRMFGHDWLNVLLVGNILIAGLEQSRFFPSANLMLGFEFNETAQLGVGVSITPTKDNPAHLIVAAGWTPRVGEFYLPIHFFFVPDINGHHKIGVTLGVNFQ